MVGRAVVLVVGGSDTSGLNDRATAFSPHPPTWAQAFHPSFGSRADTGTGSSYPTLGVPRIRIWVEYVVLAGLQVRPLRSGVADICRP